MEASALSNGLRNVAVLFVMLGLLATACTEESRDKIREVLPSGVSGLPSVTGLPSPRPTGPTGGGSGEPTAPTGPTETGEPTAPTGPTGPVETATEEPTEPPTESPAEPTEGPGLGQGALILAIIRILEGLGEQPPPTEQPSPTETPSPEATTGPEGETATGPTGGAAGVTHAITGPRGRRVRRKATRPRRWCRPRHRAPRRARPGCCSCSSRCSEASSGTCGGGPDAGELITVERALGQSTNRVRSRQACYSRPFAVRNP